MQNGDDISKNEKVITDLLPRCKINIFGFAHSILYSSMAYHAPEPWGCIKLVVRIPTGTHCDSQTFHTEPKMTKKIVTTLSSTLVLVMF